MMLLLTFSASAQQVISTLGGNASGAGGSAAFTAGQVVYTTIIGSSGSTAQGVQQAYEISVVTTTEEAKGISLVFSAYPNPVTDFLTLKVEYYEVEKLAYWLYDITGNLLQNKKVESEETIISMQQLMPGSYILRITDISKIVKTFKIIKNN
jgi:hypothetical protein